MATARKTRKPPEPVPTANARPTGSLAERTPPAGKGVFTTFDPYFSDHLELEQDITALDYAFATDMEQAKHVVAVRINGEPRPLSAVPVPGDDLEYYFAPEPTVRIEWLASVKWSVSRNIIVQAVALSQAGKTRYGLRETQRQPEDDAVPEKDRSTRRAAKAEVTSKTGYLQPNRAGKKLMSAWIPEADLARFKAILAARGTTVQDHVAAMVAAEVAAASTPAALERIAREQAQRLRDTLRPKPKR